MVTQGTGHAIALLAKALDMRGYLTAAAFLRTLGTCHGTGRFLHARDPLRALYLAR